VVVDDDDRVDVEGPLREELVGGSTLLESFRPFAILAAYEKLL
jgi:hypothetical protein